ncbi:MAG: hypothetical protein HY810_01445 [Candidatus Omnitrophica bacterium]|nr:hypothetical protein [Candidatus Omnitrophota bacterium]
MDNSREEVFSISIEDLQQEALNVTGRKLTDKELRVAVKGINEGLSFGIDTIFKTAIEEAIESS